MYLPEGIIYNSLLDMKNLCNDEIIQLNLPKSKTSFTNLSKLSLCIMPVNHWLFSKSVNINGEIVTCEVIIKHLKIKLGMCIF